jgi:chromosome segregation ATPase
MSDTLSKVFDVESIDQTKTEIITKDGEILPSDTAIEDDFRTSRQNLRELLEQGQTALMHALDVARQSEHPRAFEVVGNLMKQLADVNQQLMDIHQQKKKLEDPGKESKENKAKTVNNNLFVGTTADLNKLLKDMTKGG